MGAPNKEVKEELEKPLLDNGEGLVNSSGLLEEDEERKE